MGKKYNNILAIDTSTKNLKLGLQFGGDRLIQSNEEIEKSHGRFIIKKIGELFQTASLEIKDLEAIVVGIGPGSFTGLRIGLAAAKGMAVALNIPIIGINSFEIAAVRLKNVEDTIYVIVPLNRDEGIMCNINDGLFNQDNISIIKYNELFEKIGHSSLASFGLNFSELFPEMTNKDYSDYLNFNASDMLYLGLEKLNKGEIADLASLEPMYLQKSQAEIRFDQYREENK